MKPTDDGREALVARIREDMPGFMDRLFGKGQWTYDEAENLYIAPDPHHKGEGFGFVAVKPDGSYFRGVRPTSVLQ